MIAVIDYNVGNVKSVCNAFRHIGCDVKLSCEPEIIETAAGVVLPGVAAFGYAVSALGNLTELIKNLFWRAGLCSVFVSATRCFLTKATSMVNIKGLAWYPEM